MGNTARDQPSSQPSAFTLVELLTVVAIIGVLMTLLFSVFGAVGESARWVEAKHDVVQIVTAIDAYFTDYGHYPLPSPGSGEDPTEWTFSTSNRELFYPLRGISQGIANENNALNPRSIVYLNVPDVKDPANPRRGISHGDWFDPWGPQLGKPESGIYHTRIDGTYGNQVTDPYPGFDSDEAKGLSSRKTVPHGVIAWSVAKTGETTYDLRDQVLSWQ